MGLVVDVEDLDQEVGGCAGNADQEEAIGLGSDRHFLVGI